jgi:hypothetical protein
MRTISMLLHCCKRLTKWWYLQGEQHPRRGEAAVKGLQNDGIYKGKFYATLL